MAANFSSQTSSLPVNLVIGETDDLFARTVILTAGRIYARGEVLGKVTSTGKYVLSASASSDGSQVPDAVLPETVDATAADTSALVYVRGDFSEAALILGAGHTLASIRETLRGKGIFTDTTQGL